jgi:hypothetical protein
MREEDSGLVWAAAYRFLFHHIVEKKTTPSRRQVVNWLVVEDADPDGVREYYTEGLHSEIVAMIKKDFEEPSGGSDEPRSDTPGDDRTSARQEA